MSLGAIGAFCLVLAGVFIVGNLWFHFVESVLDRLRRLVARRREPPAWHPLPSEEETEHEE